MKQIILLAVFAISSIVANAQNKVETINIKSSIYCDHCKKCESCGKRLENAIFGLKGIKRLDIDDKQSSLTVVYNAQKANPALIRQAIAKVGFDADDVKADPAAYARLDDCCKKPE